MMGAIEPLFKIGKIAYPYWLIVAVSASIILMIVSRKFGSDPLVVTAIYYFCTISMLFFVIAGIYLQLSSGKTLSFFEIIPSFFIVSLIYAASAMIWAKSRQDFDALIGFVGLIFISIFLSIFLSVIVNVFPKLVSLVMRVLN